MRALAIASSLLVAGSSLAIADDAAPAADSFEARSAGAVRVKHLDDIVWALTAPCDKGDDTQQRQCRRLRDTRAAQLSKATLVIEAERDAFTMGAWNAQKKSAPLTLSACISCSGVTVDGQTWFVVGTKEGNPAPKFEGGKLKVGNIHENARTFPDDATAKKYAAATANAKIQLLVQVPPQKARWSDAGKQGLALDVIGYRVYSPCDGTVVCTSHKSGPGEIDKKACAGTVASGSTQASETVDPAMKQALKPVVDKAKACYAKHKVGGKAKLRMVVAGDGSVSLYEQQGDFANTPTGSCIDVAVKSAAFPTSDRAERAFSVSISLP